MEGEYVDRLYYLAIEEIGDGFSFENHDGYMIESPACHTHPSDSIIKIINNINKLSHSKPAYIFTT